jgi:hypothetical protein
MINSDVLQDDLQFFLKKMEFTADEFQEIMNQKPVPHLAFKSYSTFEYPLLKKILRLLVIAKKIIK